MKYTYEISFNGSDYLDLYPNSDLEMNGGWETDTMIWREKISELKITKALNETVYETLETWFEDKTYFETRIFVKILKNDAQDSLHWFGVKWGKLDKHLTTYTVEPLTYDIWGRYFEAVRDKQRKTNFTAGAESYHYYGDTWPYQYIANAQATPIWYAIVQLATEFNSWPEADVVSSFINQDDYEDTTSVGTYYGMPKDYVTGKQSFATFCGLILARDGYSLNDVFDWLTLFRAYAFIDSNDKLRFEHISFFNDRLTDNAVDFSAYIEDYNEAWSYENTSIPILERISMSPNDDADIDDFKDQEITYSSIRNRQDMTTEEYSYQMFGDLSFYSSDSITDELVIFGGINNQIYELRDEDMVSFDSDYNYFDIEWNVSTGDTRCVSNDLYIGSTSMEITVNLLTLTGSTPSLRFFLEDRSSGALISNVITAGVLGETTGTLTPTAYPYDAMLVIEGWVANDGAATGYVVVYDDQAAGSKKIMTPTIEGVISSDYITNGAMGIGNIFERWWQDDRLSRSGEFNDDNYDFTSTQYNLRRDTLKFHYSGVINPLYGFNDGTRIGKIEKWSRSLSTDFYEIDVIYQEDE